jgi:16S rRNA (cytosine1402-N4)-methyltransferase
VSARHLPVLRDEVLAALAPRDGEAVVDGTFGAGGYAQALLAAARCRVYGIDRDPEAIAAGAGLAAESGGRLELIEGRFSEMDALLAARGVERADGVALDLGVSSMQLDQAERGFSIQRDGPLDMRMAKQGESAADLVNGCDEAELADLIWRYGEERRSRAVARAIVRARAAKPIERTAELADIVAKAVGRTPGMHPATRTFQALRICVNDELGELTRGLAAAERLLAPGGRLAVVAFHSLEDREVKQFLQTRSGVEPGASRHAPAARRTRRAPSFRLLFRGARMPAEAEVARNPRARSARLRAAVRTEAPAWEGEA